MQTPVSWAKGLCTTHSPTAPCWSPWLCQSLFYMHYKRRKKWFSVRKPSDTKAWKLTSPMCSWHRKCKFQQYQYCGIHPSCDHTLIVGHISQRRIDRYSEVWNKSLKYLKNWTFQKCFCRLKTQLTWTLISTQSTKAHVGTDTDIVSCSVLSSGSLLDFLKSDTGCKLHLPKLIDFSAQVIFTLTTTCCSLSIMVVKRSVTVSIAELKGGTTTKSTNLSLHC